MCGPSPNPGQHREAGDDGGAAGDALGEPHCRLRRLCQVSTFAFLGLHMQLPISLHARPPSSHAIVGRPNPHSAEVGSYIGRRGPDHRSMWPSENYLFPIAFVGCQVITSLRVATHSRR